MTKLERLKAAWDAAGAYADAADAAAEGARDAAYDAVDSACTARSAYLAEFKKQKEKRQMAFEEWITKWCKCDTFEDTEQHFEHLAMEGLNGPNDMLSHIEEAFAAGVESTKEITNDKP